MSTTYTDLQSYNYGPLETFTYQGMQGPAAAGAGSNLYLYTYDTVGYALDSSGTGYNFSDLYAAHFTQPRAAAVARDDANRVYLFNWTGDTFAHSSDAGSTWTIVTTAPPWPSANECVQYMVCHTAGELHLFQSQTTGGNQGIWRSTDAGNSWTHIVTMPAANQGNRGGWLGLGSSRLWYAESNTPLVSGSLPTDRATFDIKSCNWDGSGITLHGSTNFDMPGVAFGAPRWLKVRAIDDTFCLVLGNTFPKIYKVTSTGSVSDITPSGLTSEIPWDLVIFDAATYVCAGEDTTTLEVAVFRTTNGGTSWTRVQTIPALEGFAQVTGGLQQFINVDVVIGSSTDAYMYGYGHVDVQQYIWKTTNAGLTWTSFRNLAEIPPTSDTDTNVGRGGVLAAAAAPLVAIPTRLATIVG